MVFILFPRGILNNISLELLFIREDRENQVTFEYLKSEEIKITSNYYLH